MDMAHTDSSVDGHAWKEETVRLGHQERDAVTQTARYLFEQLDEDNNGTLDKFEIKKLLRSLGMQADAASIDEILPAMDPNGSGGVSLGNFLAWWEQAGSDFKHKMAVLAAGMEKQCAAEDAAALLAQRRYRGYRARHGLLFSELAVKQVYTAPNIRCVHLLQLARVLRSAPESRTATAIRFVDQLISRVEAGQPTDKRFFAQLDPFTRQQLLTRCRIATYRAPHYVFEQGEPSNDMFYFVVSGKVGVVIDSAKKFEMLAGATFGEKALSQDNDVGVRTAGILAETDCIMATLTRADYYRTTGSLEPNVVKVLRMQTDDRTGNQVALITNLFSDLQFFKNLDHDAIRTQLSRSCQHRRVQKNEMLFRQGDDAETFYIVVQGYVRVVVDRKVVLNLGPGMTFGELGVLGKTPAERRRTATIIGGSVPGVATKQEWNGATEGLTRSSAMDVCDLAELSRDQYILYTQGSEDRIRQVLLLQPDQRSDEHLKLLMDLFAETRFFQRLSSAFTQRQVCRNLRTVLCPAGHVLFREGSFGGTFYIIIRGSVQGIVPTKSGDAAKTRTFELRAGDTFGELAVTGRTEEQRKRTATMRCTEECLLATLSRASYLKVTGGLEESAFAILRKTSTKRTESDLAFLSDFFGHVDFIKDLHFPMLQAACCSIMELKALDAKDILFEQHECSDGVFYILLRGRLKIEIDGHDVGRYHPPEAFGTSKYALSFDPDKGDDNLRLQCDRTVVALAPRSDQRLKNRIRVDGFPRSWKPEDVFEVFKVFGKIDTVKLCSTNDDGKTDDNQFDVARWAIVQYASESVAKRASREKMLVALDDDTGLPIIASTFDNAARRPLSEAFPLGVDMERERKLTEVRVDSSLVEQEDTERDVVVAFLTRSDYKVHCHGVLEEVTKLLGMKPRSRTIKQLNLLKDFFASTDVFGDISRSSMLQRNLSRFLGIVALNPNESLYRESTKADKMYIVIRGQIQLCSTDIPDSENVTRTAGQILGEEAVQKKPAQYAHTAVSSGPALLALVYRDDYMRVCATDDMQQTVDAFWSLGVQESAPSGPEEEPIMDFDGYKQLYLRIGKVIATRERFSMSELRQSMHADWQNDLQEFGDPDLESLTHWQYTASMYQLIDEWCGGVESTELYGDLLRLMLEFTTDATDNGLVLKPLHNVSCQFQRLSDMRHDASQGVLRQIQDSKIGTTTQAGSSGLRTAFLFQNMGHASSSNQSAPKLGDALSADEKQEQYFRDMFDSIDADGSGTLDRLELAELSISMGRELRHHELDAAMAEMDPNGDGSVDFDELKIWFKSLMDSDSLVREVFASADKDESGVIDREELRLIMKELGNPLSPSQLDEAMAAMDLDGSGEVDFVEFSGWWSKLSSKQKLKAHGQDPQAEYYKEMFQNADTRGEGSLDREELSTLMAELGRPMREHELETAMQIMDEDGGGTVDFDEFHKWVAWLIDGDMTVRKIFDSVDADGSGMLDYEEVRAALARLCAQKDGTEMSEQQIQEAIEFMDLDKSGEINFEEFSTWWNVYEFQQRFTPDDTVIQHQREAFDTVAKSRVAGYGAAGNEQAKKTATLNIMQGRGTIDIHGLFELCSILGRAIHDHERVGLSKDVIEDCGNDSEITFEVFMNFFHDLQDKDHILLTMFESADNNDCGLLLRDGVKQVLRLYKQNQAKRNIHAPPNLRANQSDMFSHGSHQAVGNQSLFGDLLHDSARTSFDDDDNDDDARMVVTDEEVDQALADMLEYQRARYKLRRSRKRGPEATLIAPPLKGQVDFDTFRYWATVQRCKDPALRETKRIVQADARKHDRRDRFFRAMVSIDQQSANAQGLRVQMPTPQQGDDTERFPIKSTPMSQPSPVAANLNGVGPIDTPNRRPATCTGVPERHGHSIASRRRTSRRNNRRPKIELQMSHRRPLSPFGSSAAWPPMQPARVSTLGATKMTARTSQGKRNDGRRANSFDELLELTASESYTMALDWPESSADSTLRPGQTKFQPTDLRPKSAGALQRFYSSDAARLSRSSSSDAIWGAGLAGASEKRVTAKFSSGPKPQRLSQLATSRDQQRRGDERLRLGTASITSSASITNFAMSTEAPQMHELWHERLSNTESQLEAVPSFLDPTRGGRQYPGLGTRLNALHTVRKQESSARNQTNWCDTAAIKDKRPLIVRATSQYSA